MPATPAQAALDSKTLSDLEVLSTSANGGLTLFKLIDRTRTRAGRACLRRLLAEPLRTPEEILAAQIAHQELAGDAELCVAALCKSHPDDVEQYLNANWQLPSARSTVSRVIATAWSAPWYRDYKGFAEKGQRYVSGLLDAACALRERLCDAKSVLLKDVGASLGKTLDAVESCGLDRARAAFAFESFDNVARGVAKPLLLETIAHLGRIEAMLSVGIAAGENQWVYPTLGSSLELVGLVHPFLGSSGVRNHLTLSRDVRVCFVTGPNMGGKSTFLKAVAVAMILAQAGAAVPAIRMEFAPVGALFSSIDASDSLAAGESFYLAEVHRIRDLALALADCDSALAILDEPFRGTNAVDAAEATVAVIQRLVRHANAIVFVASHIAEVASSFSSDGRVAMVHFSADVSNDNPMFDFMIRPGVSTQRLGMVLLRQEGVLDLLDRPSPVETSRTS